MLRILWQVECGYVVELLTPNKNQPSFLEEKKGVKSFPIKRRLKHSSLQIMARRLLCKRKAPLLQCDKRERVAPTTTCKPTGTREVTPPHSRISNEMHLHIFLYTIYMF